MSTSLMSTSIVSTPVLIRRGASALSVVALALSLAWSGPSAAVPPAGGSNPSQVQKDLSWLRRATASFHDFQQGVDAGWDTDITGCLDHPDGAMGHHFANIDALFDGGAIEVARPEALIYEPEADGSMRLVAVEYIILEEHLARTAPAPELLGQDFHFNEAFEVWALHAWVWRHNPVGMFKDWNPNVSCEFAQS